MVRTLVSLLKLPAVRLLLVVIVAAGAYVFFTGGGATHAYSDSDPAYNRAYWQEQIARHGSAKAFALFKQKNESAPRERQHFSAHVFGVTLAEHDGVQGITSCDPSFGYGCYHGFFSKIISEGGEGYITKLDAACVAAHGPFGTGCQHGIGHGILEYVGYQRIADALELCRQTTQKVPLLGCTSGVFMEYFNPLVQTGDTLSQGQRPLDKARPQEPCDTVKEEFKQSCYFELGHSYYLHLRNAPVEQGSLCAQVPRAYAAYCYLGLGDSQGPISGYKLQESITFCNTFEGEGRIACRAGLSWSFYANPAYRAEGADICSLETSEDTKECKKWADLTLGQTNQ